MKNFKRVISAVIALALSASTLVAVSASKFADVDSTNTYAEAIEVLTALDIIHGYEEEGGLVFKPDGDITRAEAATMIVGALNMTKEAQAAAGSSKFTDVNEKASWASGYVNVGVAQGFINGMDDTTFAPQENVTYAQMCVMLTLITGYGDYAAAYGGYPTGYTTMAASAGINKGVALSNDAKLKRGQVAQMIYNALTAPLLGVKAYNLAGNDYAVQDGGDLAFKTLMSDKFDGYQADVLVEAVPKSDASLSKGEVKLSLTTATFLEESKTKATSIGNSIAFDEVGVDKYLFTSGKAILTKDADDKWHLVYFKPSNIDKIVLNAADYVTLADGGKSANATNATMLPGAGDGRVTFGSKSYPINVNGSDPTVPASLSTTTDAWFVGAIYVNGYRYGDITQTNVDTVMGYAQGEVTLIDNRKSETVMTTSGGTTSSIYYHADGYDLMMVNAYDVVKVDDILHSNGKTSIQISHKGGNGLNPNVNTIRLSDDAIADGDISLTVKNAAGEDVALSSIKKGDILAFASRVPVAGATTLPSKIEDPEVIDLIVTDEKISGMAAREDATEHTYTIGDTSYKTVLWGDPQLTIGTTYSIQLDPFGRIYDYADVEAIAERYAIAETYNSVDGLKVILPDGTQKYYEISATAVTNSNPAVTTGATANATTIATSGAITPADFGAFVNQTGANKPAVQNRVIKYTIKSSTGKINSIQLVGATRTYATAITARAEYKDSTGKLGDYTISQSTDAIYYNSPTDFSKFAVSSFKDKEKYAGSVFLDTNTNTVAFAIITATGTDINGDSRFAVVRKNAAQTQSNGDTCFSVNVLYEGEEKDILFNTTSGARGLNPGDAIFFKTDEDGLVSSYIRVLSASAGTPFAAGLNYNLATLAGGTDNIPNTNAGVAIPAGGTVTATENYLYDSTKWNFVVGPTAGNEEYQLVYGIITNVTSRGVEFTTPTGGVETPTAPVDLDGDGTPDPFNYDSTTNTYVGEAGFTTGDMYDFTTTNRNRTATTKTSDSIIDTRTSGKTKVYGIKSDCVNYRYAVNETPATPHLAIGVGAPTASTLSAYLVNRNAGIYNLTGLSDGLGANHLTYGLALVVNGDIAEIYTITQ